MSLLARNIRSNFVNRIIVAIITFIAVPYLVSKLGVSGYGLYALLTILILYMTVGDIGLSKSVARFVATYRTDDRLQHIYATFFTLLCLLSSTTLVVSILFETPLLLALGLEPKSTAALYYICVATAISMMFRSFAIGIMFGHENFIFFNQSNVVFEAAKWSISVYLSAPGNDALETVMFAQLLILVLQTFTLFVYCKAYFFQSGSFKAPKSFWAREILGFSSKVALSDFFTKVISYSDKIIVAVLGSISGISFYYIAFQVSSKIFDIPSNILLAYYPKYAVAFSTHDNENLASLLKMSTRVILIAVSPIIFTIILGAEPLLSLWVGLDVAAETSLLLQILTIGTLIACCLAPMLNLLNAIGFPQYILANNIAASLVVIGLGIVLVEEYGVMGGALAWSAVQFLPLLFVAPKVGKLLEFSITRYLMLSALLPVTVIGATFIILYSFLVSFLESELACLLIVNLAISFVIYKALLTPRAKSMILSKVLKKND